MLKLIGMIFIFMCW